MKPLISWFLVLCLLAESTAAWAVYPANGLMHIPPSTSASERDWPSYLEPYKALAAEYNDLSYRQIRKELQKQTRILAPYLQGPMTARIYRSPDATAEQVLLQQLQDPVFRDAYVRALVLQMLYLKRGPLSDGKYMLFSLGASATSLPLTYITVAIIQFLHTHVPSIPLELAGPVVGVAMLVGYFFVIAQLGETYLRRRQKNIEADLTRVLKDAPVLQNLEYMSRIFQKALDQGLCGIALQSPGSETTGIRADARTETTEEEAPSESAEAVQNQKKAL